MLIRVPRLLKWPLLGLLLLALLIISSDALRLNPAQEEAAAYRYDLVRWEASNFLSKWIHRLVRTLPWNSVSREERFRRVHEYFRLQSDVSSLKDQLARVVARSSDATGLEVMGLEAQLEEIRSRRARLRNDVEETIEAVISSVITEEGLSLWGELVFPPVDIRLTEPPRLLVTSPRDRVRRAHEVLLDPDINVADRDRVEDKLLEQANLAALVTGIGGVATYPASVRNDRPLLATLQTSAHEWLHHYFFFRPLGQNLRKTSEMLTLNETMADIAGREIGKRAFEKLDGVPDPPPFPDQQGRTNETRPDEDAFDFDREMRKTRLRVDELLAEGNIEEAEAYMEERRVFFVDNGVYIRKLNQAYFAFNGTYAESAASVSPVGDQLHRFRDLTPDLGAFIKGISGISSYSKFLNKLQQLETQASAPSTQ